MFPRSDDEPSSGSSRIAWSGWLNVDNRQHHLIYYATCFYFKLQKCSLVRTVEANIIHQQRDARMWSTIFLLISSIDIPMGTIALCTWNWSLHCMSDGASLRGSTLARNHRYYQFLCKDNKVSQWVCWMSMRINTTDDIDSGPWWHKTSSGHSAVLPIVRYIDLGNTTICQIWYYIQDTFIEIQSHVLWGSVNAWWKPKSNSKLPWMPRSYLCCS